MKVAIYARVSTDEQTEQNQLNILEKWAGDRGWEIIDRYCDVGSAWQTKGDRDELNRLLTDCHHGKVNLVLIYDLSRLTRKGTAEMLNTLKKFHDNGADVYSYSEPFINQPSELVTSIIIPIYAYMAKAFSDQLSAKTKAGMERARLQGKHLGRPKKI
jgi:putative DNA-invertase from lambdoid prophage Rac